MVVREKRILFYIASLGLGHARRTLPVIRHYLPKNAVFIVSTGSALALLRRELEGENVTFYDRPFYPTFERGSGFMHYVYFCTDTLGMLRVAREEHRFCEQLVAKERLDLIFSDGSYGAYSEHIPSFFIFHQIEFDLTSALLRAASRRFNLHRFRRFTKVIVPDYEDDNENLSGTLSHNPTAKVLGVAYVGILSDVVAERRKKDVDLLVMVSGYLRDSMPALIDRLITQARAIPGKKVFVLGDMTSDERKDLGDGITLLSHVSGNERLSLLARAKIFVSRSGYTTVLDLAELDAKAILVATPGQSEQEYLARYLDEKGYFVSYVRQDEIVLANAIAQLATKRGFPSRAKTRDALRKIDWLVDDALRAQNVQTTAQSETG